MPYRSIVAAFAAALALAASASSASALPPASSKPPEPKVERRKPADCHYDVRTHRINGVMVTHRHIGDRCEIRRVQKLNSFRSKRLPAIVSPRTSECN